MTTQRERDAEAKKEKAAEERAGRMVPDPDERPEEPAKGDDSYRGRIDPASMIISPQEKIPETPELVPLGAPGGPEITPFGNDTTLYGTETPYRATPPTNIGSVAQLAATGTPPTAANAGGTNFVNCDDNPTPVAAVAPTVAGTTTNGQTLTCTPAPSPWVPAATSYAYQWFRGDTAISGATAATRVLAAADVGYRMQCRVTGINTYGGSSPAVSVPTAVVA